MGERLIPRSRMEKYQRPPKTLPRSQGHYQEWIDACKGGPPATCDFVTYSGPLAETVLLGNAAYRAGGGFEWDAANLKAAGNERAQQLLRPEFRAGWTV